jgi:hypothetical protein
MYPHSATGGAALASGQVMRISTAAALAIAAVTLAVPPVAAAAATLDADPSARCYREQETVRLNGAGFTPNGVVQFTREGIPLGDPNDPITADAGGQLVGLQLILPGLVSGQRELTYVATDQTNSTLSADVSLLVTATDVDLRPAGGAPNRLLTIRARGFFGGGTLYAHIVRTGKRSGRVRNMRIGAVQGSCKKVTARRRLFFKDTAPGRYRVQFDTFRRYRARRSIETNFSVTVYRRAGTARASGLSPAS